MPPTATGLLRCADLAMYRAKAGRAAVEIYRHEVDDDGNRLRLVEELRDAVEDGQFELHYQPQVDLRTGEVSPSRPCCAGPIPGSALIPPLDFLPLAEEAGLMQSLTALVLEQALTQCAAWRRDGQPVTVAVNISATNLLDPASSTPSSPPLAEHRSAGVGASPRDHRDHADHQDFDACKLVIEQLRDLGIGVSIDDFGAGFTSLAYLGSLAVGELKLDRSFLARLATGDTGRNTELVRATIELGHKLGMRVVAEGIEDPAALELLASLGCDLAQGYFISRPMSAQDLALPTPTRIVRKSHRPADRGSPILAHATARAAR